MTSCATCHVELHSSLVCEACGALQALVAPPTPFGIFGLTVGQQVDGAALKKRLLKLSRALHPDFFGNADAATQQLAIDNSAELNSAFELLRDELARADWLVRFLDGPDENEERQMPQAFLMEVMDWNEQLEEARASAPESPQRLAATQLGETLQSERAAILSNIEQQLTPLPAAGAPELIEIRKQMNAIRYVDRALLQITELAILAEQ